MTDKIILTFGKVLARFMVKHQLKIPCFYSKGSFSVLFCMGDNIYEMPPLKDYSGHGWMKEIKREIDLQLEKDLKKMPKPKKKPDMYINKMHYKIP